MKCTRVKLVNFCHYREKEVHLHEGLTALMGPNGSGKSSLFGAIPFALTGNNPMSGNKNDNICDRAPASEASYVELDFTHGNEVATVRRNLRPSRPTATLTLSGGEVIEGDEKVTARIEQILGVGGDIINDIVIVPQREIFGFIDKTPGKRADQFQRLFRTEKAAKIYKVVGDHMKNLEVPVIGVDIDQLRQEITEATQAIATLEPQLTMPSYEDIQAHREQNVSLVRYFDQRQNLVSQLQTTQQQKSALTQQRTESATKLAKLRSEFVELEAALTSKEDQVVRVQAALTRLQQYQKIQESHHAIATRLQQARERQHSLVAPQQPDDFIDPEQAVSNTIGLRHEVVELERFLKSFQGDMQECPTCRTPMTQLQGRLDESTQRLATLRQSLQAAMDLESRVNTYVAQHRKYLQENQGLEQQIASLIQQRDDLPAPEQEQVDEAAAQAVIQDAQAAKQQVNQYREWINGLQGSISHDEGAANTLDQQLDWLKQQIDAIPDYSPEERENAVIYVTQWDEVAKQRRGIEYELGLARKTLDYATQQMENAQRVAAEGERVRAWRQQLSDIRDVVHKDAAPRFVAQRNLRRLESSMNETLEMFGANFRIEADEGLSFVGHLRSGSRQTAHRLSGGQQVALALAFRLSLNLMFAENIGALYLDEPTAYLDDERIQGLGPVLDQLRAFSANRGLQCMIVTHEQSLDRLFDHVIRV